MLIDRATAGAPHSRAGPITASYRYVPGLVLLYTAYLASCFQKVCSRFVRFDSRTPCLWQAELLRAEQDVLCLASFLKIKQFHVLGVSGGGPYALACAAYAPQLVQGVLLISSAGWPGESTLLQRCIAKQRLTDSVIRQALSMVSRVRVIALTRRSGDWLVELPTTNVP